MNRKEMLAKMAGMRFEEAAELFSEETLLSMQMLSVIGGSHNTCSDTWCVNNGCNPNDRPWPQVCCSNNACSTLTSGSTSGSTTPCP